MDEIARALAAGDAAAALALARAALRVRIGDPELLDLIDRLESGGADVAQGGDWHPDERWQIFGSARGGMGRVYFVRDRDWGNRALAVKSLVGDAAPDALALFRREAQLWLDLGGHPHIVSGFYTLELEGALRFFMEYVPGGDLAHRLGAGRPPTQQALDYAIQLAAALAYVHAQGAAHRDVKPANCLVMDDDTVRLTDFGLGRSGTTGAPDLGLVAGTPAYMAPEQWRGLDAAGPPADVYALGVVLCELFGAGRPFDASPEWLARRRPRLSERAARLATGGAPPEMILRLLHEEEEPLLPDAASGLDRLAARCLGKDPAWRPAAREVAGELAALYGRVAGHPYRRGSWDELGRTMSGENNRAVSYAVMGQVATARTLLDGVLAGDASAPVPLANRLVLDANDGLRQPGELALRLGAALGASELAPLAQRLAAYQATEPPQPPPFMVRGRRVDVLAGERVIAGIALASGDGASEEVTAAAATADEAHVLLGTRLLVEGQALTARTLALKVYDVATRRQRTLPAPGDVRITALAGRAGEAFVGNDAGVIARVRLTDGAVLASRRAHAGRVTSLALRGDGWLVSHGDDGRAVLWPVAPDFRPEPPFPLAVVATLSARDRGFADRRRDAILARVAAGSAGALAEIEELRTNHPEYRRDAELVARVAAAACRWADRVAVAAWFPTAGTPPLAGAPGGAGKLPRRATCQAVRGHDIFVGTERGEVALGKVWRVDAHGPAPVRTVALSACGRWVASAGSDFVPKIWDARTGALVARLVGHRGLAETVAFAPDSAFVATGSGDHAARVFTLPAGALVATLDLLDQPVRAVAWSADGSQLVTTTSDGATRAFVVDATWRSRT